MLEGFLLINKPINISSYGCIAHIKKIIGKNNKIGHAGTLDPFATGLLIIGIGRKATRNLSLFMKYSKEYIAQGKLGELTDTLDHTGNIIKMDQSTTIDPHTAIDADSKIDFLTKIDSTAKKIDPHAHVSYEMLLNAINSLGSAYEQTPPIYSAKKINGKRLYALARAGKKSPEELRQLAQQKNRLVQLFDIELIDFTSSFFTIRAHVSHGTYVRSLVNDIAQRSNNYATTYSLKRTKIGQISCNMAVNLATLDNLEAVQKSLIDVDNFLQKFTTNDIF